MAHDCARHRSQGMRAFQQTIRGEGGDAHSVTGAEKIPGPGPSSAQSGGAGFGHGEGLVSKVRG
ncbi:hypothetical protein NicSoilB8_36820 [Arthrobacter sp. NicSoilB8]|nr:hypothetical protein NicSoilB8_36820 [Arthrobacter sp. NicSoilB8]